MKRNNFRSYLDDIDEDDMILVGSRFFDAIQRQSKRPLGRMRNEREFSTPDRRDHRPVPHRERGF